MSETHVMAWPRPSEADGICRWVDQVVVFAVRERIEGWVDQLEPRQVLVIGRAEASDEERAMHHPEMEPVAYRAEVLPLVMSGEGVLNGVEAVEQALRRAHR